MFLIEDIFTDINNNDILYLLGFIASSNIRINDGFEICVKECDKYILDKINRMIFYNTLVIEKCKYNMVKISVKSKSIYNRLNEIMYKENEIKFPIFEEKYLYYFIRGYIEGNCLCNSIKNNHMCIINCNNVEFTNDFIKKCNVKCYIKDDYNIEIYDNNLLDFLHKVYKDVLITSDSLYMNHIYDFYNKLCSWNPCLYNNSLYFNYIKIIPEACPPYKQHISDSGYDLTLLKKIKTNGDVEFYDTSIIIEPMFGYYFDLVGRSSISKSGYMLANNIGIIDRTYQGSIIVALIKIDKSKPDLELPARLVQIIPRQIQHLEAIEITHDKLLLSNRNDGGFGSTNTK